ncbi:hypothetical protein B0T24DRAFT_672989 [Lasiosphaeria ovina]|uniref:SET domain-containing protein n=1 Tax=Lasiosphaeria ovina TaxID=92902 RepID=A0AAE0NKE0_9PEZI|nr:hypothetical protein B0T24DRAFT_672989 [Lasiosphaeria ovina]
MTAWDQLSQSLVEDKQHGNHDTATPDPELPKLTEGNMIDFNTMLQASLNAALIAFTTPISVLKSKDDKEESKATISTSSDSSSESDDAGGDALSSSQSEPYFALDDIKRVSRMDNRYVALTHPIQAYPDNDAIILKGYRNGIRVFEVRPKQRNLSARKNVTDQAEAPLSSSDSITSQDVPASTDHFGSVSPNTTASLGLEELCVKDEASALTGPAAHVDNAGDRRVSQRPAFSKKYEDEDEEDEDEEDEEDEDEDDDNDAPPHQYQDFFEIRPSPLGGLGAFAVRDLKHGETILIEQPILRTTHFSFGSDFYNLSEDDQAVILALHRPDGPDGIDGIVRINAFQIPGGVALFQVASRFNHACAPVRNVRYGYDAARNAMTFTVSVYEVPRGAELLIMYGSNTLELYRTFGFRCSCGGCVPLTQCDIDRFHAQAYSVC